MGENQESILFEVRVDAEQYNDESRVIREAQAALVLAIDKTKAAQKALTEERKRGALGDQEYAQKAVALRAELRQHQAQQRELTKGQETLDKSYTAAAGSIDQLKAKSAELTIQYNSLSKEQRLNTEAGRALTEELDGVNKALLAGGVAINDHRRNVGNYKQAVEPLVVELAKLQAQEKTLAFGSAELAENQKRQVGFQTAAQRAAASAGLTYEQAQAKIAGYSAAIKPAVENLVKLEEQQQAVGEGSQEYAKIGFQIAQLEKQIQQVPGETKKVGDALADIDEKTNVFGGHVGLLKQRFNEAKQGIELAKGGFTGLKGAIAATGIGVLILALGALFEYFTKSDEGAEDLAAALAFLKGGFSVLEGVVIGTGRGLVLVFTKPKEAASELLDFLEGQVINRVKSFGVIWEAIKNGDAKGLANGLLQFNTGIENSIDKVQAFGKEMGRAAGVAYDLSRANDKLDDDQRAAIVLNEKQKNQIDKLVLSAKDRTLTEQQRLANLDKAGKLETEMLARTTKLAQEKLRILQATNAEADRTGKISDEQRQAAVEAEAEVVKLAGESATQQQAIQNRRSALLEQEASQRKAAADKAKSDQEKREAAELASRARTLNLRKGFIELELQATRAGSAQELKLQSEKLDIERRLQLNVAKLTAGQKELIQRQYETAMQELTRETTRKRAAAELQATVDNTSAKLAAVRTGSEEELRLQLDLIEQQRVQQLAAIDSRASEETQAAQRRLIDATAEKKANDLKYADRLAALKIYFQQERNALEQARAGGLITEKQYQLDVYQQELASATARKAVAERYGKDAADIDQELTNLRIGHLKEVTQAERDVANQRAEITRDFSILVGQFMADSLDDASLALENFGKKALLMLVDTVEKTILAAQLKILAESFAQSDSIATFGATGGIRAALIIAAVTAATAPLKSLLSQPSTSASKFEHGGVVHGPTHAQGGIQMYHRSGAHLGEFEGLETILVPGVYKNRALFAAASALNVAAGGKPFASASMASALAVPSKYAEGGLVRYDAAYMDQLRQGSAAPIDYARLADAVGGRQLPLDYQKLAEVVIAGVAALPPIAVQEITRKQQGISTAQNRAQI